MGPGVERPCDPARASVEGYGAVPLPGPGSDPEGEKVDCDLTPSRSSSSSSTCRRMSREALIGRRPGSPREEELQGSRDASLGSGVGGVARIRRQQKAMIIGSRRWPWKASANRKRGC